MKHSKAYRALSIVLCLLMLLSAMPLAVFATGAETSLTIASTKTSALAPGVQEQEIVAYDAQGKRIVYYAISADIATNSDVLVKANYHDNDNTGVWGKATVMEQASAAKEKRGYNVVASTNASYYNVSTGQPTGAFVMEGVNINGNSMGNSYEFFAVMKDGTAMIGKRGTFSQYADNVQEAVGGYRMLVWDGQIVSGLDTTNKYPRSTVGIKADGNVVLMVADGNQSPYSVGLNYQEQAEIMLSLGCVAAIELDGGGSATYAAKLEGTDEVVVRNSCCDGTVRSVSNTIMVISTAAADGTFDHANLSTEYAFHAPHSQVRIAATGADKGGHSAEIPPDVTWTLSNDSYGTIADGVFSSNGKTGTVTAQMLHGGKVVGELDITLVNPTSIAFSSSAKTVPYGKSSDMTITAMYNGAEVYATADAYAFTLSDTAAGNMNGFTFTAAEDESIGGATLTAAYRYADALDPIAVTITFGKGSDILFDFENADISDWTDYYGMVNSGYTGGYTNIYSTTESGNYSSNVNMDTFLATRENGGQVKNGQYSLGVTMDYLQSTEHGEWQYAYLYYLGDLLTYRDVKNGVNGTRLGMWMYIPQEAVGSCARLAYTYETADGKLNTAYLYFTYQYVDKGFSKLTSENIPEAGWAYVYCDLDAISKTYVTSSVYGARQDGARTDYAPAFIQFIVSSSAYGAERCTFYIDDITLDYSDVVDDRDAPLVSNPLVLDDLNSYALDGRTIGFNTISVTADVAEDMSHGDNFTGLNPTTAQIYVDGQAVTTNYAAGKISAAGIVLPDGTHDIAFEIADNQGNYTRVTRQIVIAAGSSYPVVSLEGQALEAGLLKTGAQYNLLLKTSDVSKIQSITTTIWLNSSSTWELEHMTVLNGFTSTYTVDRNACTATITLTRTGSSAATGEAVLATIPVRNWYWNGSAGVDAATQWNSKNHAPQIILSYKVKSGAVAYIDGYTVDANNYVAGFSNTKTDVETELNSSIANLKNTIGTWHTHTAAAIADKAATCTEVGYIGRTVCSVCNSVVDWGETLPATGHNYIVIDNKLTCANCHEVMNGEYEGKIYIDGVIAEGWVNGNTYYADGVMVTGAYVIGGVAYVFDDNGIYQPDALFSGFIDTPRGRMYFLSNDSYITGYSYISNTPYYFDGKGLAYDGEYVIGGETCLFEKGVFVSAASSDVVLAGWAGVEAHFVLYANGTLKFSGSGDMYYHQSNATIPWAKLRESITRVEIGKDITSIARFALAHAYYVEEIVFEEGSKLETIGYQSFHYLNRIKELILPDYVKTIEWCAFGYWTSLKSIYLPDSLESINEKAFEKHNADLVLQVAEGTYAAQFAEKYGFKVQLREKVPQVVAQGACGQTAVWTLYDNGTLEISGMGAIADYGYSKYGANAAPWALYREEIKTVVIGKDITVIGEFSFYQCTALASLIFEEGSKLEVIGKGAVGYCSSLETVTLPASLREIADNAFYFSGLRTVAFEENSVLAIIGSYAFRDNTSLVSLFIPETVEELGSSILYNSNEATVQVADDTYSYDYAVKNRFKMEVRPHSPRVKASGACGQTAVWTLYDNGTLEISGMGAIADYGYSKYGANAAPWALYREEIKTVVIGKDITVIGEFSFYQCTALASLIFEEGSKLEVIGKGAVGYCSSLETVTLPASLREIADNAFYFSGLRTVAFEENSVLATIGSYAFRDNTSLETVYIPDGVTHIGSAIFYVCGENVTVYVANNSLAHQYAVKNGIHAVVR